MGDDLNTGAMTEAAAPPVNTDQNAIPQQEQEHVVPLSALQAERKSRQQLEENLKMMQEHLALIEARTNQPQAQQPKDDMDEDDVLTVRDLKRILEKKEKQYETSIQELKVIQQHPDYQEIVSKYLPDVIKSNPSLRNTLVNDPNRYELAYWLAKNSDAYRNESKQTAKNADAEKIIQNAERAGSLTAVGHSVGGTPKVSYKNMSDADFMKQVHRNLGYS
jgi:hypothetical protein